MLTQISPTRTTQFQGEKLGPICLIVPPSIILAKERTFPHLGILKVASTLRQKKVPLDHLDLSGVSDFQGAVSKYLQENPTATFGITATSPQIPASVEILKVIKEQDPGKKVIIGGPHGTLVNAARKNELAKERPGRAVRHFRELSELFDTVIAGDGELATFRALERPDLQLIDAADPSSDFWLNTYELDNLPFPDRDLVDLYSYEYYIDGIRATTMIQQLGCPYPCGFCGGRNTPYLRKVRLRSLEEILAEVEDIYRRGFRAIMLYDDELNLKKDELITRMYAIAKLSEKLGTELRFRGFVKSNLFDADQAKAMFEAGFREILIGFESGSPQILKNIQKKATREQNFRCMEVAKKVGLRVKALMSMGHPGETEETVRETEDWIMAVQPESFDLTRITVYHGTPYSDDAVPHKTLSGVWTYEIFGDQRLHFRDVDFLKEYSFYKGDKGDAMGLGDFTTFTDHLSSEDLGRLRKETEDRLREKLDQPYQVSAPGVDFDHSMGMGLPENILRSTRAN